MLPRTVASWPMSSIVSVPPTVTAPLAVMSPPPLASARLPLTAAVPSCSAPAAPRLALRAIKMLTGPPKRLPSAPSRMSRPALSALAPESVSAVPSAWVMSRPALAESVLAVRAPSTSAFASASVTAPALPPTGPWSSLPTAPSVTAAPPVCSVSAPAMLAAALSVMAPSVVKLALPVAVTPPRSRPVASVTVRFAPSSARPAKSLAAWSSVMFQVVLPLRAVARVVAALTMAVPACWTMAP